MIMCSTCTIHHAGRPSPCSALPIAAPARSTRPCVLQISFYDLSRSTCDISGRMHARGAMGMPLCLGTAWSAQSEQEQIIYGDDAGAVIMLLCGTRETRDLRNDSGRKDYAVLHQEHSDWVTQVGQCCAVGCSVLLAGKGSRF